MASSHQPPSRPSGSRRAAPRSGLSRLLLGLISLGERTTQPRRNPRRDPHQPRRERILMPEKPSQRIQPPPLSTQAPYDRVVPLDGIHSAAMPPISNPRVSHQGQALPRRVQRIRSRPSGRGDRQSGKGNIALAPRSRKPHQTANATARRSFSLAAFTQGMRLVILGVGVWAIVGTVLSISNPSSQSGQISQAAADNLQTATDVQLVGATSQSEYLSRLELGREMDGLGIKVAALTRDLPDLTPGVFVVDLDSGDYFSLNGDQTFAAASMIKVPILVAFFQEVDAGKIRLDEMLTLQEGDLASGSGDMQFAGVGTQYSALETAINMIVISDNTATNMLIRRLGGIRVLNQRFQEWGLQQTVLHNLLPDLEGTNTLSPKELSNLIARVSEGELVSMKSRDRLLNIMEQTVNNSLLPAGLGDGASIAHKTGDIGSLAGDAGLVDMPNGRRYAISVMVKRPHNDARAYELVYQISAAAYEYLNQTISSPVNSSIHTSPANLPPSPDPALSPSTNPPAPNPTNSNEVTR
ncbi:serine hydrolase [Thermocoleostomius sinensis]|uniref:Class A beta-lactamase-related serine hydrolase n=1 Tax=Thermocoleostomius sinensis A174 TaxID=2016057 RepID=A0A9E8ZCQ3_9CYAN|nr:serine hydrolase [Thermocoleostomius sinensis]WAL59427.1 class A beta-lactamase-related serine hydrolase [Thermocoleostomius sinensis A174]